MNSADGGYSYAVGLSGEMPTPSSIKKDLKEESVSCLGAIACLDWPIGCRATSFKAFHILKWLRYLDIGWMVD